MRLSEENSLVQLRNLLTQFRASSSPRDFLHIYDVGEAVPLTGFYADRPIQYLFSDMGTLAIQQKISQQLFAKGDCAHGPGYRDAPNRDARGWVLSSAEEYILNFASTQRYPC